MKESMRIEGCVGAKLNPRHINGWAIEVSTSMW